MPRKQLDILKDLFMAHRDGDEPRYQEIAHEYVRYLHWKGFHKKAKEFEAILNATERTKIIETEKKTHQAILPFFESVENETSKKSNFSKYEHAWYVSRGSEINFIQTQRLLSNLISQKKDHFSLEEISNIIGYSAEKTRGFSRLLQFLGFLEDKTKTPTELAKTIYRVDPYFEDLGTLWFLHYHISSQPVLIIWNRIANHLMTRGQFTLEDAEEVLQDQRVYHNEYAFKHHLRKEFRVFTRAYLESAFKKLNLLITNDNQVFIRTNTTSLPDEVLLAAILLYKQRFHADEVALEIKALFQAENSPGRLFYLKEHKFREALERLRQNGYITIESFADLDQIKFSKTTDYLEQLKIYYHNKFGV
ncbi:MAG: DUF4007 family protein [Promethearchaeota archaeon]